MASRKITVEENHFRIQKTRDADYVDVDRILTPDRTNLPLYKQLTPFIKCFFNDHSLSILLVGQSGSGKSYSLTGHGKKKLGIAQMILKDLCRIEDGRRIFLKVYTFMSSHKDCVKLLVETNVNNADAARKSRKVVANARLSNKGMITVPFLDGLSSVEIKEYNQGVIVLTDLLNHRTTKKGPVNNNSSREHLCLSYISLKNNIVSKLSIYDLCGGEKSDPKVTPLKETVDINTHNSVLLRLLHARYVGGTAPSSIPGSIYKAEMTPICHRENKLIIVPHFDLDDRYETNNKYMLRELKSIITLRDRPRRKESATRIRAKVSRRDRSSSI